MACPSRNPDRPLTANQMLQLTALFLAGALSKETAVSAADLPQSLATSNPLIIGALRDKGLALSRSRRVKGRSWTEYWLTAEGKDAALRLQAGRD